MSYDEYDVFPTLSQLIAFHFPIKQTGSHLGQNHVTQTPANAIAAPI
jgi:hypothetical protein